MGYTKDAIKGISWLGTFRILFRGLTYLKLAIIARILTPTQFGITDLAILVLAFIEVLTETGINIFIIQEDEEIDKYINTAWVISIIRGVLITLLIILLSPLIVEYFNSPETLPLLYLISLVPFLRGFINPSVAKFLKNLEYKKHFFYRSSITFFEILTTILVVYFTKNPSGIVWGLIAGAVWEIILTFIVARPIPHFILDISLFRNVMRRGIWLTITGIFNYLYLNIDDFVVSKLLGKAPLGLYMRSFSISLLPITEIADVFAQTTFPIYVKLIKEPQRLKKAYYRTLYIVSLLVIPVGIIFYFFPERIILIILGDQWLSSAAALKVLAVFGTVRAILTTSIGLFYSTKRQDIMTRLTFISFLGLVLTIVPFVMKWGIVGAGLSSLTGTIITIPFAIYYIRKIFIQLEKDAHTNNS